MKKYFYIFVAVLLLTTSCNDKIVSPGSEFYPGDPDENFSPTLSVDNTYRNVALNRLAMASSSYDYNLTAHLATDGIIESELPAYINVSTSNGPAPKNEREWMFDMKTNTSFKFSGKSEYVQLDFFNYLPSFDITRIVVEVTPKVKQETYYGAPGQEAGQINPTARRQPQYMDINWTVILMGSEDGANWDVLDSVKGKGTKINEPLKKGDKDYSHLRLLFNSDNGESWAIADWDFYDKDMVYQPVLNNRTEVYYRGDLTPIVPSDNFKSTWMSAGSEEEWIYVDLGAKCSINEVKTYWLSDVPQGKIQLSNDALNWTDAADIAADAKVSGKARYVRLLCTAGGPYVLSEIEVFGKGGLITTPKAQPQAADGKLYLTGGNWKIQRANLVKGNAAEISAAGYDDSQWLTATVPGTALVSYLNAGAIPDPDYSDYQTQVSESFFRSDFWYRDEFEVPADFGKERMLLNFNGINWKADIYLNGKQAGHIDGAFIRGKFDVTDLIQPGTNTLAVRIIRNAFPGSIKEQTALSTDSNGGILGADDPTFHATVGWDWIPTVRGRDIGIWNDVYLSAVGNVTIEDPFVRSEVESEKKATVFVETTVKNRSAKESSGKVEGSFGDIAFSQNVTLAPGEEKTVTFPAIELNNPKLWWPAGYGEQNLYDVCINYTENGAVSDSREFKSGVRQMTFDDSDGTLRMYVNGRRFIGRGGNWGFAESNLRYRAREYDAAVRYHADMHFTMIRNWVGQVGDEEFYDACDKYGVMVWQDFWLANPWDGPDPYDESMFLDNASDYIKRIRNHASIGLYCGRNEGMPTETLNAALQDLTDELHTGLHYIPHSAASVVSGGGPYRAMPVKQYFNMRGADRMHSERGMPNVMNYESLIRTIPEDKVWPQSNLWGLHDYTLQSAQYASSFNDMVAKGFGEPQNAREFTELAQLINYDGYRAIFEGRSAHRRGMLLWMSHPCWPSMVWQTYDYFFEPTGAYFGCKKANEPLHIQFNCLTNNIEVVNFSAGSGHKLTAEAEILSMNGEVIWSKSANITSDEDTTVECFPVEVPENVSDVYFIRLKLSESGTVSENFYWQGKEEGNYQALKTLAKAQVSVKASTSKSSDSWKSEVVISNKSSVPAIMLRLKACDGNGELITPVLYSDNYFFLMPGESKTIDVEVADFDSNGAPRFEISGYNL